MFISSCTLKKSKALFAHLLSQEKNKKAITRSGLGKKAKQYKINL